MKKILLFLLMFSLFITKTYALTIRETMDVQDEYSTIEEGSIIIGATRFSSDSVVTASKAATAGANDAMLYLMNNGTSSGYKTPGVYYYVDSYVGWFYLDSENKVTTVTEPEELEKLSRLDIYYIDNVEKILEIDYPYQNIDETDLPDGVVYKDNKLYINATVQKVEFKTNDDKKVNFVMDLTTSKFVEDIRSCYTVNNNTITGYDSECGNNIVIPTEINGVKITNIGRSAFENKNLVDVVIPNTINSIEDNAFINNKLEKVVIKDKYSETDFSNYGNNIFGEFDNITYDNVLTRISNYIDSDYVINHYKNFDTKNLISEEDDFRLTGYIGNSLIKKFENNGYSKNYRYCGENCEYYGDLEDETQDIYGISLEKIDNLSYKITIQNYDNNRINKVSKKINVSFYETGLKKDNDIVLEAFNNLEIDHRFDHVYSSERRNTRVKSLQDLEDIYNIDIVLSKIGCGVVDWENEEMLTGHCGYATYYMKDNVLYQYESELGIASSGNTYYPKERVEDYENIDTYVEHILNLFPELSGVTNYDVIENEDGLVYKETDKNTLYNYETAKNYNIEIIDKDYLETWVIVFMDFYDDNYDENGYTKESCFEINEGIITDYDGKCGVNVKIPDTIDSVDVLEIGDSVFENMQIKSVRLPDKLKNIGNNSFRGNLLTSINIPNTVTNIGESAFYNNSLTSIDIPDNITKINEDAFSYNELTSIEIPDSVEEIGYAAFSGNQIETIKLGINLKKIDKYAFSDNKIKELEIPSSVKLINHAAFYINEIETLNLSEGIEEIGGNAFSNNKIKILNLPDSLKRIGIQAFTNNQLPDEDAFIYNRKYENGNYVWDYESLNSYGGANRNNVVIPDNVVTIGETAFYGCNIEKVKLPQNLKTIEYEAFSYNNLSSIDLPYGIETIEQFSFNNNELTFVVIPDSVQNIYSNIFGGNKFEGENSFIYSKDENNRIDYSYLVAYYSNTYEIDEVIIPKTVKKIGQYAFSSNLIKKIEIPYGVEEIGDYAFSGVEINEISLPKSLKKIGKQIFSINPELSEDQGYVYARNEDGTIDKTILMAYIAKIYGSSLTLPEGIVEIRENVFYHNGRIKKLILPSTLKKIGNSAFQFSNLFFVTFNDNLEFIGDYAFSDNNIAEINIPSSVKTIGDYAFSKNRIVEITLNEGLEKIGNRAFFEFINSRPIECINIPSSVTDVGERAFWLNVQKINILGKESEEDFNYLGIDPFGDITSVKTTVIYELSKGKIELPTLPIEIHSYDLSHNIQRTIEITEIKYSFEQNEDLTYNLTLLISGNKTYDILEDDNLRIAAIFRLHGSCGSENISIGLPYYPEMSNGNSLKEYEITYENLPIKELTLEVYQPQ